MKLYGVQFDIVWEDRQANFEKVRLLLSDAQIEEGGLIVLPEMFASGFSMDVDSISGGEEFLAEIAERYGVYVLGGVVSRADGGRGYNNAVVLDAGGAEVARYTKLHPFSFAGEAERYQPGDDVVTFECGGCVVSPFVCYDLRFPEVFRCAVRRGTTVFVVIANWPEPRIYHWVTLLQARAIENQSYVIGVNRCGDDPKLAYPGRSLIVDPRGKILADAGSGENVISAELDMAALSNYRSRFSALRDIREEYLG